MCGSGYYWGSISSNCTCETVEAADVVISVGCVWTDYSTLGYSLLLKPEKSITIGTDRVTVKGGETFGCIDMEVRVVQQLSKIACTLKVLVWHVQTNCTTHCWRTVTSMTRCVRAMHTQDERLTSREVDERTKLDHQPGCPRLTL
eukprot:GHUV01043648.1.p1 GENE.GHUV01043648.1~~GHUV01043648.1.p1  ORF type:complete len:145 (+),score=23.97 GHUV01043648.1:324-758(+)